MNANGTLFSFDRGDSGACDQPSRAMRVQGAFWICLERRSSATASPSAASGVVEAEMAFLKAGEIRERRTCLWWEDLPAFISEEGLCLLW